MSRGKRSDVTLFEGIPSLPGMPGSGWMPAMGVSADSARQESLWQIIDDRMRGRWLYATLAGLALSAALGVVGYLSAEPMYGSSGTIEIAPEVMPIYQRIDPLTISNYDRFVATQVEYIRSGTVIGEALKDPEVIKLGMTKGMIRDGLDVDRDPRSQLVYVSVENEDPVKAEVALNAVLKAYISKHGQYSRQQSDTMVNDLDDNIQQYERQRASINKQIHHITEAYNASDLESIQEGNLEQMNWLRMQILEGKRVLARTQARENAPGETDKVQVATPLALQRVEPRLAQLQQQVDEASYQFEMIASRYQPGSIAYRQAQRNKQIAEDAFERMYEAAAAKLRELGPGALQDAGMSELITPQDITDYETRYSELDAQQRKLIGDMARLTELRYEDAKLLKDIEGMRDRMNNFAREIKGLDKIVTVSQYGTRAEEPTRDARRSRALMGLALGMAASFGGFFLLGTVDRRAFGSSQLGLGGHLPPCLGVLPDLGASLSDPHTSDIASHCVHQIRNQIEAVREPNAGYVLAISSPFQGDGKTSIVMALGWSYAAAGYNTLLIDCDMVGRSLTRQLGLTGREGVKEALVAKELNGSVTRLPWANLSAVPVGVDARFGPANVRRVDLDNLVSQVRGLYDIIIVDTGPLLGSLESTPVMAVADGVVLSVRRGRSRNKLEECVNRLRLVGTTCVGVILNCAARRDCNRYVSEASLAAAEEERLGRGALVRGAAPTTAPGERNALVRAVQSTTRQREVQGERGSSGSDPNS